MTVIVLHSLLLVMYYITYQMLGALWDKGCNFQCLAVGYLYGISLTGGT